jgi:hypothetical protein
VYRKESFGRGGSRLGSRASPRGFASPYPSVISLPNASLLQAEAKFAMPVIDGHGGLRALMVIKVPRRMALDNA